VVHLPPEPTAAHAAAVRQRPGHRLLERAGHEQRGKVHTGVDGELQRSPEATVDFHEDVTAGGVVALAFDHCYAAPL
jgi:hypothetical protein